jgi:hypothetical protein
MRKEKERVLTDAPRFIVNVDTKWTNHVPLEEGQVSQWWNVAVLDVYVCGGSGGV